MDDSSKSAKPSLYVVDALNFLFRAFHALPPLTTKGGQPTGAVYGLCQMLLRIERENRPTHLCVVFDGPGHNFRHELFSGYKAQRPRFGQPREPKETKEPKETRIPRKPGKTGSYKGEVRSWKLEAWKLGLSRRKRGQQFRFPTSPLPIP